MFGEGLWLRHFVAALVVSGRLVWSGLSLGNFSFKHTHTHTHIQRHAHSIGALINITRSRALYRVPLVSSPLTCRHALCSASGPTGPSPCSLLKRRRRDT
uniref:Putative secreted protein n=1 Tax=Anopheles darlingi TaxID=43151 RepID=A0A2M4DFX7_ANODA